MYINKNFREQYGGPLKMKHKLLYDQAIPLLGIYLEKIIIQKDSCTPIFTEALFTLSKTWKQPRCPSTNERMKKKCTYIQWNIQFTSVQALSHVQLMATPWFVACARQASLSIINTQSSKRLTSIESVMPSSHLILCRPLRLLPPIPPSIRVSPMSQLFAWGSQSTRVSALASFLPKNTQNWSPSEWTGWISLQSNGLSRVFSKTTVQKHQFFSTQPSSESNSHIHTWPLEKP